MCIDGRKFKGVNGKEKKVSVRKVDEGMKGVDEDI